MARKRKQTRRAVKAKATRASDFRTFGGVLMGAIFPMAPLKARLGFVRKREKEARRAATAIR